MIYNKFKSKEAHARLDELFNLDKRVKIEILTQKRSLSQNAGIWLWFTYMEEQTGTFKQAWHDYFLDMFPIFQEVTILNEIKLIKIGTSKASKPQISKWMNEIDIYCSTEIGITLPKLKSPEAMRLYQFYSERDMI